jgi:hypothetical protein
MSQFDSIRFQPSRPLLKEVSADRLNAILSEIKKNRPRGERGITVRQAGDATYIGLAANFKQSNAPTETFPFEIFSTQTSNNEDQFTVTVEPGTINNILAQNTFSGGIDLTKFSIPADSLRYVCLSVESNDGNIGSSTLSVETQIPPQQEAVENSLPASVKILLGVVYNGTVKQIATDNLRAYGTILFTTYQANGRASNWYIWTWQHA